MSTAFFWERPIQHSLRSTASAEGFSGGFVMPYHAVLEELERRPDLDPSDYVAFAPDDARRQFSYGSEQVTHGAAAAALVAARGVLARMELTKEQAVRVRAFDEKEVLANPFRLFEEDRTEVEPISFGVVDRGLYPGREVAAAHPLPEACNTDLGEYDNAHRLRAACMEILETSTADGHTLLPIRDVAEATGELSAVHEIPLDAEMVDICRDDFEPVISVIGDEEDRMVRLDRYGGEREADSLGGQ